jgi:phage terminase large subunit
MIFPIICLYDTTGSVTEQSQNQSHPGARRPEAEKFVHYEYEQNRQGEWISGYPDRDNHLIDATRYALERVSGKYRSQA